jgi:adenylate/nucleoside-diphosphate kinase
MSLPIKPFSPKEIAKAIAHANARKAPGYGLITGKVLKELPKKAVTLLTIFYNSMLRLSYYPLLWKLALIIMVPKPRTPINDVTSYRPISLLTIPSKIFERFLLKRLRPNVDFSGLLPNYQFGFRAGHPTIHQSHRIVHEIAKSLEGKRLCTAVFLDVPQAFDKFWHTACYINSRPHSLDRIISS